MCWRSDRLVDGDKRSAVSGSPLSSPLLSPSLLSSPLLPPHTRLPATQQLNHLMAAVCFAPTLPFSLPPHFSPPLSSPPPSSPPPRHSTAEQPDGCCLLCSTWALLSTAP